MGFDKGLALEWPQRACGLKLVSCSEGFRDAKDA